MAAIGPTIIPAILVMVVITLGCSSSSPFGQGSTAAAGLSKNNFRVVKSNVRGESYGFSFLGFIPIVPVRVSEAKGDLYQKLGKEGIIVEGRSIALANATEDRTSFYFIIGSVPRITLTADVIEFLDDNAIREKGLQEKAPQWCGTHFC